ncbi:MAG: hypothetical protein ACI8TP_003176, partial [Acidimicrobiales bacterium]
VTFYQVAPIHVLMYAGRHLSGVSETTRVRIGNGMEVAQLGPHAQMVRAPPSASEQTDADIG